MHDILMKPRSRVRKATVKSNELRSIDIQEVHALFHDVPIEIAMYDLKGRYKFINKMYVPNEDLRKKLIGKDDDYYFQKVGINPEGAQKRRQYFERVLKEKRIIKFTEKLYIPENDKTLYYKRSFRPLFNTNNASEIAYVYLFGSNLNAAVLGQKELRYLAYHDKLTGLKNRLAFYEQLEQVIVEAERDGHQMTALLFCDLDNFKLVNDSLGHSFGDLLLKEVSSRLRLCLRKSDYVYRFGGDEFIVIMKHISKDYDAGRVAEKFIKYLAKPYFINGHKIPYLTSSVGIVLFPKDGEDVETLVKNADTAMYSAKKKGKNNYQFFSQTMTQHAIRRLKIEKNLTNLVAKNAYEDQFKILYQPIVEKHPSGEYKIIGAEALLRWSNPELGYVTPETFIPVAEETNLISDIGEWIFNKTCHDYSALMKRTNHSLVLSVNFSAKQLRSADVVKRLERILKATDFSAQFLQLELTETSYIDDHQEVLNNLNDLEKLGVKLALDDFGVGFASLSYLHKVPASTIKIDKSFIRFLSTSSRHKELVKSIIMLGKNLNKDVVAEGVEQVEDLYLLDSQQCNKFQGFLFSAPITLEDFEILLKKENLLSTVIK